MQTQPTRLTTWTGRTLSTLATVFLGLDTVGKLIRPQAVIDGTAQLGYPTTIIFGLGIVLGVCVVTYAIPRTAVLGAILLTGYLGGAVATHVRVQNPLLTHVLFPVYLGLLIWAGLLLRDRRVRALLPWRESA